jgi:hypothetical protein
MPNDFSNRQCYTGGQAFDVARIRIEQAVIATLISAGFDQVTSETEATRSLVIGPADPWIFVGDTDGNTDSDDGDAAFSRLSIALSALFPVVSVEMIDSAIVHVLLFKDGSLVDKCGNGMFPWFQFKNDTEAAEFKGNPMLWTECLPPPNTAEDFRAAWTQNRSGNAILRDTANLLGWDPHLAFAGYTVHVDGIGIFKYDDFLNLKTRQGFTELHFSRAGDIERWVASIDFVK